MTIDLSEYPGIEITRNGLSYKTKFCLGCGYRLSEDWSVHGVMAESKYAHRLCWRQMSTEKQKEISHLDLEELSVLSVNASMRRHGVRYPV